MIAEEISKIKEHIKIHARQEHRAYKISEIMWKAVKELEQAAELEKEKTERRQQMNEEELAEEYCNNEVPFDITESGEKLYTESDLKYAFLAGFAEGRQKLHKVADGDLPKETDFVESDTLLLIVQLKGTKHRRYELGRYNFSGNMFIFPHLKIVEDVIAWCELPEIKEE